MAVRHKYSYSLIFYIVSLAMSVPDDATDCVNPDFDLIVIGGGSGGMYTVFLVDSRFVPQISPLALLGAASQRPLSPLFE